MTSDILLREYNSLPENLQAVVLDFVLFLKTKKEAFLKPTEPKTRKTPKAGFGKHKVWMSPDFDEPLECFKEYMP